MFVHNLGFNLQPLRSALRLTVWGGLLLSLMACGGATDGRAPGETDTCYEGTVGIAIDASLAPAMEVEVQQYESTYTKAKFRVMQVSEAEAVAAFINDSVKLIAIPRALRPDEEQAIRKQKITPRATAVGRDAVALIVHPQSPIDTLNLEQLQRLIRGQALTWAQLSSLGAKSKSGVSGRDSVSVVIDHPGSSLLSYLQDSVLSQGTQLTKRLFALGSNGAVIDYVAQHPGAIGLIGLSWISDRNDSTANTFLSKIKVLRVARAPGTEAVEPFQYHLLKRNYPLIRKLYMIHRQPRVGLASCFASFVAGDKGQLILHQLDLMPYYGQVRIVELKTGDYRR